MNKEGTTRALAAVALASVFHLGLVAAVFVTPPVHPYAQPGAVFEVVEFAEVHAPVSSPPISEPVVSEIAPKIDSDPVPVEPVDEPEPLPEVDPIEPVADVIPELFEPEISVPEPPAPQVAVSEPDPVLTEQDTQAEKTAPVTTAAEQMIEETSTEIEVADDFVSTDLEAAYRNNPPPPYPLVARRRGVEGVVLLEVSLDAHGYPSEVEIKESSGFSILDDSARNAVRKWRFEPARRGGRGVKSVVEVPLRFALR